MVVVAQANVRAPHEGVLLAAFQTAKGTAVSDFTTASAARLWTDQVLLDVVPEPHGQTWMDETSGPPAAGAAAGRQQPRGQFTTKLTPTSAEWLLRSNFGAFAGGAFSLASQVAATQFLTLAWVEDRHLGTTSTKRLVRVRDAWCHRLTLTVPADPGPVLATADFAGVTTAEQLLNAGGVTLPAVPMRAADTAVFPASGATLVRDPAGDNEALRIYGATLVLEQGLGHQWDQATFLYDVYKRGKLKASLTYEGPLTDETYTLLSRGLAGSTDRYTLSCTVGATVLTVDLYEVRVRTTELGQQAAAQPRIRAEGIARKDSSGNLVTITLA